MKTSLCSFTIWFFAIASLSTQTAAADEKNRPAGLLFRESFDDSQLLKREWYDGEKFAIDKQDAKAGEGSLSFHFPAKATNADNTRGMRRIFEPSETIYLKFHLRLSKGFGWTGRNYHPHLIQFMTTENGVWHGPAASHLTVYIEPVNGKLRLAAQDIQNKDQPHGLTQGELKGGYNGQLYDSEKELFKDDEWHLVEALFQLNSLDVKNDKPSKDGIVQGWFDGEKVIDRTDVVLRSTDFPKMKFNQLLVLPYFGPGLLPHEQTLWIDELAVGTQRLERRGDEAMIRVMAICLFRRGNEILVTEGLDTANNHRYARPLGGGIDLGETSAQAIVREIREEIGAEVRGLKLLGVLENLFELEGHQRHEVVFIYDGQFADRSLYELAEIKLRDGGWSTGAIWRPLAWFSEECMLVPVGIEKLLH